MTPARAEIITVRRDQLIPHPLLAALPTAGESLEFIREKLRDGGRKTAPDQGLEGLRSEAEELRSSLSDFGQIEPLDVCLYQGEPDKFWLLDGRHRLESTDDTAFEARLHPLERAEQIVFTKLFDRQHYTQAQRAWFVVCAHPEIAGAAKPTGGRPKNWYNLYQFSDKKGKNAPHPLSLRSLAERYGTRRQSLAEAVATYDEAEALGELEAVSVQVRLGAGLGAIRAGLKGKEQTGVTPKTTPDRHYEFAKMGISRLSRTFEAWEVLADEQRIDLTAKIVELAGKIPPALKKRMAREFQS